MIRRIALIPVMALLSGCAVAKTVVAVPVGLAAIAVMMAASGGGSNQKPPKSVFEPLEHDPMTVGGTFSVGPRFRLEIRGEELTIVNGFCSTVTARRVASHPWKAGKPIHEFVVTGSRDIKPAPCGEYAARMRTMKMWAGRYKIDGQAAFTSSIAIKAYDAQGKIVDAPYSFPGEAD